MEWSEKAEITYGGVRALVFFDLVYSKPKAINQHDFCIICDAAVAMWGEFKCESQEAASSLWTYDKQMWQMLL